MTTILKSSAHNMILSRVDHWAQKSCEFLTYVGY